MLHSEGTSDHLLPKVHLVFLVSCHPFWDLRSLLFLENFLKHTQPPHIRLTHTPTHTHAHTLTLTHSRTTHIGRRLSDLESFRLAPGSHFFQISILRQRGYSGSEMAPFCSRIILLWGFKVGEISKNNLLDERNAGWVKDLLLQINAVNVYPRFLDFWT